MTAEQRLNAALAELDRTRKARARAFTDQDRDATWGEFVKALAQYNRCLRETQTATAGSGA